MALYQSFYGLARDAFASPENPAQMFVAQTYHDSVVTLVRALIAQKPFIAISGEGGSGKTTVLDTALQALGDRVRVTRARCEQDEPLDLASLLENALGKESGSLRTHDIDAVFEALVQAANGSKHRVLVLDHAELISPDVLDYLLLLSTLSGPNKPLLQVVLVGPPGLVDGLRPEIADSIRAGAHASVLALSEQEASRYLDYRLATGGASTKDILTEGAAVEIVRIGAGNPRRLDNILRDALSLGAQRYCHPIPGSIVVEAEASPHSDDPLLAHRARSPQSVRDPETGARPGIGFEKLPARVPVAGGLALTLPRRKTRIRGMSVAAFVIFVASGVGLWRFSAWDYWTLPDRAFAHNREAPRSLAAMVSLVRADVTPLGHASDLPAARQEIATAAEQPPSVEPASVEPASGEPASAADATPPSSTPVSAGLAEATSAPVQSEANSEAVPATAETVPTGSAASTDPHSSDPRESASEPSRSENQSRAEAERPTEAAPPPAVTSLAPDAAPLAPEAASAAVPVSPPQVSAEQPQVSAEQEPPRPALPAATVSALLNRGNAMLAHGDVSAARLLYEYAAPVSGRAATAAGMTYDPAFLAQIRAHGITPDANAAAGWYSKAVALGDRDAEELLKRLRPEPPG